MATTKYIVNNISGQTITGDFTIDGNLTVSQSTVSNSVGSYRALFTQTGPIIGTSINDFDYGLIIGETYEITSYVGTDDFSNIANVVSGTINQTGCVFIATGSTPSVWINGSELTSNGGLIVDVLENTLGYDITWVWEPFGATGQYIGFIDSIGPLINSFPRNKSSIIMESNPHQNFFGSTIQIVVAIGSAIAKDDVIEIGVIDWSTINPLNDSLYYTPIEIKIKQDLDTTPMIINGTISPSFPFGYASFDIFCGSNLLYSYYSSDATSVNNIDELVTLLNNDSDTNILGLFSNDGVGGIVLTMATNLKNQLCPDGTLTFDVYSD